MAASTKLNQRNNLSTDVGVVGRKTGLTISNDLERNAEDGMEDFDAFFSPVKELSEYAISPSVDEISQIRDQYPIQKNMPFSDGEEEEAENMSTSMDIEQSTIIRDPTEVLTQRQQSPTAFISPKNRATVASSKVNTLSSAVKSMKSPAAQLVRKLYLQSPGLVSSPIERSRQTQEMAQAEALSSSSKEASSIQMAQVLSYSLSQEEQRHEQPIKTKSKKNKAFVTQKMKQRTPSPSVLSSDIEDDMPADLAKETNQTLGADVSGDSSEDNQPDKVIVAQNVLSKQTKQTAYDSSTQKKSSQDTASKSAKQNRVESAVINKQPKAKSQKLQILKKHLVDNVPQNHGKNEEQPEPQSTTPSVSLKSGSRKRAYNPDDEDMVVSSKSQTKQAKLDKASSHTEAQGVKPRRGRPPSTLKDTSKKTKESTEKNIATNPTEHIVEELGHETSPPAEKEQQKLRKLQRTKQEESQSGQSKSQTQKLVSRGRPKKNVALLTKKEPVAPDVDDNQPSSNGETSADVKLAGRHNDTKGRMKNVEEGTKSDAINKDKQPIVSIEILEEEELEDDSGTRRSGRTRIAPLKFWKNERLEYEKIDDLKKMGGKVQLMKKVVRIEDTPVVQKRKRSTASKRQVQDKQKCKKTEEESEEGEALEEEIEEEWEQSGILVGMVRTYPQERNDVVVEEEEDVAISKKAIEPRVVLGSDYKFFKTFGRDFMGTGFIELKPGTAKKMKTSGRMQLVFYVIKGTIQAEVNGLGFRLMAGGQFQVPRGNMYQIENPFAKTAELFFAQACVVEQ